MVHERSNPLDSFEQVAAAERNWLQKRREQVNQLRRERGREAARQDEQHPGKDCLGLALSGGGVRSATFNLGLLQALERYRLLEFVDYLSTVSGGGYIGSCYTWFKSLAGHFPFGTSRKDHDDPLAGKLLHWLRAHGSYLTPGNGMTVWALTAALLRGMLINLLVIVPVFLVLFGLLSYPHLGPVSWIPPEIAQILFPDPRRWEAFGWLFAGGLLVENLFFIAILLSALATAFPRLRTVLWQRRIEAFNGKLLLLGIVLLVVGTIPWAYHLLSQSFPNWIRTAMSGVSLTGVLSMLGGSRGRKEGRETQGASAGLLSVGLSLAVYGIFLWCYHLMSVTLPPLWLYLSLGVSLILAVAANINHVSMHRYYRNRLMEAYLPFRIAGLKPEQSERCLLHEIPPSDAPLHLINTNILTVGSENPKLKQRGGDNFIFSPVYSGAQHTGYIQTQNYDGGHMNLATAFSISGAAVNPNSYATRSRPLTFLMTLFNLRLGYWMRNPAYAPTNHRSWLRPTWYYYLFREMFGRGLHEKDNYVHLSDGGHFENLGLYELVRRRCRYIIVSDAGADPNWDFRDLAKAIELVRVDFGARVEIDVTPLRPQGEERISAQAFVTGKVVYDDNSEADLLYIKTAYTDDMPADVFGYRRANPQFPDQSTADQFFDETQFEAYRELGFQIGSRVCDCSAPEKLAVFFSHLREHPSTASS